MGTFHNNSIFWVEVDKIKPNPFQPRRDFDGKALEDLADSIRQYGVLQPLVVTRSEFEKEDGGLRVEYELIAGERRLRASKIAGLFQVPVVIRSQEEDSKVKLELAIIENLQREDLNPIDRALAFEKLHKDFGLTHVDIGKKMGKSREFVSNSVRLLQLPADMQQAVTDKKITEGHTRPLLMLSDRPEEQMTLFHDILARKMSVREAERISRRIAQDKVRKQKFILNPHIQHAERALSENLGARVHIEQKEKGGKIFIDYFTEEELQHILEVLGKREDIKGEEISSDTSPQPNSPIPIESALSREEIVPESDTPDLYTGKVSIHHEIEHKYEKTLVEQPESLPAGKPVDNDSIFNTHPIFYFDENVEK